MLINFNGHFVSAETYNLMATLVSIAMRSQTGHGAGGQTSHVPHGAVAETFTRYVPAAERQDTKRRTILLSSILALW